MDRKEVGAIKKFREGLRAMGVTFSGGDTAKPIRTAWEALGPKNQAKFYENGQGPATLDQFLAQTESGAGEPPTSPVPSVEELDAEAAAWAKADPNASSAVATLRAAQITSNSVGGSLSRPGRGYDGVGLDFGPPRGRSRESSPRGRSRVPPARRSRSRSCRRGKRASLSSSQLRGPVRREQRRARSSESSNQGSEHGRRSPSTHRGRGASPSSSPSRPRVSDRERQAAAIAAMEEVEGSVRQVSANAAFAASPTVNTASPGALPTQAMQWMGMAMPPFGGIPPWMNMWPWMAAPGTSAGWPAAALACGAPNSAGAQAPTEDTCQTYRRSLKPLPSGAWPKKKEVLGLAASYPPKPQKPLYQSSKQLKDHKHKGQSDPFGFYITHPKDEETKVHIYLDSGKVWIEGPLRANALEMVFPWTGEGKPQSRRQKKKAKNNSGGAADNMEPAEAAQHLRDILGGRG